MIRCVAAIDENRGLADATGIPWDLPTDRQFYIDQISKGLILMGKGTYREMESPRHGRTNYVATRRKEPLKPGFEAVSDVPAFFKQHKNELINTIGGARLFTSTLKFADELILTQIEADFHCTKFFLEFEQHFTRQKRSEPIHENGVTFRFEVWQSKQS